MLNFREDFRERVLTMNASDFDQLALEAFAYQAKHNPVYAQYISHLGISIPNVRDYTQIPCLPIAFFKNHDVLCDGVIPEKTFESSGTTGQITSKHAIESCKFYDLLAERIFNEQYGALADYEILALLPSYLERKNASLVHMVDNFISKSGKNSGFYLYNQNELAEKIIELTDRPCKVILIGVTFALLDMSAAFPTSLKDGILIETGGMKGRKKEMIRQEVHELLKKGFGVTQVFSEYGMTELTSQAYAGADSNFQMPFSMKVLLREINDPFTPIQAFGRTGAINVIDLGNIHSCCFIETKDIGSLVNTHTFQVLGRMDNSDVRGCNLMVI
ncbi:MAG: acyl transferase [Flammeovirgaceae bacterium]